MRWRTFGLAAAFWIAASMPAQAYIDPGTGSIVAQAAIGAILAAGIFARSWWSRVSTFLGLNKTDKGAQSEERQ